MGGHSSLTGVAPPRLTTVGGGAFLGARSPRVLIFDVVLINWVLVRPNLYMEKLTFAGACLSDVSAIAVIMRVPLVALLCQTVMG
jgi:hypothetical protein